MIDIDIHFLEMMAKEYAANPNDKTSEGLQYAAIQFAKAAMDLAMIESQPSKIIEDDIPDEIFVPKHDEMAKAVEQTMSVKYTADVRPAKTVAEKDAELHTKAENDMYAVLADSFNSAMKRGE